jgi:hypothetical protein
LKLIAAMVPVRLSSVTCVVLLSALTIIGAVGAEKSWRLVRGSELKAAFGNQELADGVPYAYQFEAGGGLSGMNMGKPARGTWRVTSGELCWSWVKPKGPEECYQVRQQGQVVRLYIEGQEVLTGTLTPLVPAIMNEVKP